MNGDERRRAPKMAQENEFLTSYVQHLPRVPLDAPLLSQQTSQRLGPIGDFTGRLGMTKRRGIAHNHRTRA